MDKREIAKTRRWFGLNLHDWGEKIGAHYTTVSQIELGKRDPTPDQLNRLKALRRKMLKEMAGELET